MKELVGLADGIRESALSWRELLLDLKRRGLTIGPAVRRRRRGARLL
jgi:putative transposase